MDSESYMRNMSVNGKEVKTLYDTGSTCVAVRKGLEKSRQYTGRRRLCTFTNGPKVWCPTAMIEIAGKEYTGRVISGNLLLCGGTHRESMSTSQRFERRQTAEAQ